MRLVQIIDSLRIGGGAERLQQSFARAVAGSGVEITVITLREGELRARQALEALEVRVVPFPARRFLSPARASRVLGFLRAERFDVAHTHLVRATVLGVPAARAAGIPTVTTLHNTRRNHRLPGALLGAEALVLRHWVDRVLAVGWETARAHQERLGGRAIDVIPNAVDEGCSLADGEREALRRELGVSSQQSLVLGVGRLHRQKDFPVLLRAVSQLVAEGRDVQLRIAGKGPAEAELREEIQRLDLGDRVRLLGLRHDVPRLLAACDVYASSAAWEGLPVATLEAMAAGCPIVATAVGDVERIVPPEAGALVPPGRPQELAGAIAGLLGDPERRRAQGRAARAHAQQHHGLEAWSRRLLAIYQELGAAPPAGAPQADRRCA